jgi:hypothetical protein
MTHKNTKIMKKLITILAAVLLTASIWAQSPQKMSYQAVIRNASNSLVTNTAVGMQISILQGSTSGTAVYVETQTPTTNANGLVSLEIGGGTVVSGTFAAIDWSAGPYFIKTETDPTGGSTYSITGTSQLLSVPYALSAGNVTGLEKITEGANTGWRLIGRDTLNYGNIGSNATDLSFSDLSSTTYGATGFASTAMGLYTTASSYYSTAMGVYAEASGIASTAMGYQPTALGDYSTAMGNVTTASGKASTAMGWGTKAQAYISTVMGRYNLGGGNVTTWVATDPLFEIGNGTFSTPSNALTVLKNGKVKINTINMPETLTISSTIADNYFTFYNSLGYKGYVGILNGDNDMDFGTGSGNTTGKVNLVIGAVPKLTVNSDGNVGIGTTAPTSKLDVNGVLRASGNTWPTTGRGLELAYDANWGGSLDVGAGYIQAYSRDNAAFEVLFVGASEFDPVNDNSTRLGSSVNRWSKVYAVNGTIQTSDRRLKKEINNITYGLNTVMKLRPVTYKWKKGNQNVNLGLIAQEVQKVIPEVVDVGDDENKTLGMKYTELIPVLIKGMQEQQKEITELKQMVNKLLNRKIVVSN